VKIYAESSGTDCSIIKYRGTKGKRPLALYGSQLQKQQDKVKVER
jgi:hypothetical protein